MLQFVHQSGAEAGKDDETRRKVRSQAMRDFRRRQREEREAVTKTGRARVSKSQRQSRSPQAHPCATSNRSRAVSLQSDSTRSESSQSATFEWKSTDEFLAVPTSRTPSIALQDDHSSDGGSPGYYLTPREQSPGQYFTPPELPSNYYFAAREPSPAPSQIIYWTPELRKVELHQPSRSPSIWGSDVEAGSYPPPIQVEQTLNFCRSCTTSTLNLFICDECVALCEQQAPPHTWTRY
ncbi:hypothetical protein LTR86_002508 [Recurvomyces mirabilis]|nr:hypothetical protein LTR86_002508 [Recurvomyces mirabilis]